MQGGKDSRQQTCITAKGALVACPWFRCLILTCPCEEVIGVDLGLNRPAVTPNGTSWVVVTGKDGPPHLPLVAKLQSKG